MPINPACYNTNTLTTTASVEQIGDTDAWRSECSCGTVTCESGTYEEAVAALDTHRPGPWPA